MKKALIFFALSASALALPALAEQADPDPRYAEQNSRGTPGIERQIQRLDDQIHAEDRAGRISPSEADTLVRELRDIETQLLDIRSRTFRGSENGNAPHNWNSDAGSDPYQGRAYPNNGGSDDNRDFSADTTGRQ